MLRADVAPHLTSYRSGLGRLEPPAGGVALAPGGDNREAEEEHIFERYPEKPYESNSMKRTVGLLQDLEISQFGGGVNAARQGRTHLY